MIMAHLITGHAGKAHVKASDEARINKALYGNIEVAVDFGNNLAITLPSNNSVQIDTGLFYMQGRWIDIPAPEIVTFENGVADMNRNDLVVLRYEMDSDSSVETAELVVKKGDSVSGDAADPELETGQIDSGALVNEVPLYRIPISGINIGEPVQLFEIYQINVSNYATKSDLAEKNRLYTTDNDHQIGFLWKDGCVVPIIDSTELSGFAFRSDFTVEGDNLILNWL